MFSNEMREKTMDKIRIENISFQAFHLIVKYLYTDECEITLEVIKNHMYINFVYRIQWNYLKQQINLALKD